MKIFKPGLSIRAVSDPMGFVYGENCFGPKEEYRFIDDIRPSLKDPDCKGPDIVYAISMDVGKKIHRNSLVNAHLLYGLVTYAHGSLGTEPIRSQGHIHRRSKHGKGWSTPEVYQIWSGKGIVYMQEYAKDNPGKCYAVYAEPGDIVVVPPFWAHATISGDPDIPLTFGAWCDRDYGFEYEEVRGHKGLAWYPLIEKDGKLGWHFNDNYMKSQLIEKRPGDYTLLSVENKKCIYTQYEEDKDKFRFVPEPYLVKDVWESFVP